MLPSYGVVIGTYSSYHTDQGEWYHLDIEMQAGQTQYEAAVDVNEQQGNFQYLILKNLDASLFATVAALPDGWHHLDSNPTSGAIDYARSPILLKPLGCLAIFWGMIDAVFGTDLRPWTNVTGDEAKNALITMITSSTRLYAFGAPYTGGNGVHDVHCNQGDPPGSFQVHDGIWQDGCVFATMKDGSLSAYLGKFSTQTLNTNSQGLPK
jgi:hypothetical protein